MIGYIYLITDLKERKKYVGQHHYDKPELDPNYHGSGTLIRNIYKKRPETIKEEYLKTCYSQYELNEWEKYFIFVFDTLYPNGYNLTDGGDGGVKCNETKKKISEKLKGKHPSDETRHKMSEAQIGKHPSDETRHKMSEAHKGENHPFFGKHFSEEHKKKLSESNKGKPNLKLSKTVLQFTLDGEFVREWESTAECERNGFNHGNVAACCRGKLKSYKGYLWRYK